MARLSNYQKTLEAHDPNKIYQLSTKLKCTTVNDYIKWETLNGIVITRHLTKDELKLYLDGKLVI